MSKRILELKTNKDGSGKLLIVTRFVGSDSNSPYKVSSQGKHPDKRRLQFSIDAEYIALDSEQASELCKVIIDHFRFIIPSKS